MATEKPPELYWNEDEIPQQNQNKNGPRFNHPIRESLYEGKTKTNVLGELFLKKYKITADRTKSVYLYNGRHWQEETPEYLRSLAMNVDTYEHTSSTRRKATVDYAIDRTYQQKIEWNRLADDEIAFEDCIIKIGKTIEEDERKSHDWEYYLNSVIPHRYKSWAKCPLWEKCLDDWFETEDKKLALQEYFGYVLCYHVKFKKALLLIGDSDAGKSVPCDILKEMVGEPYTCSISPEKMDDSSAVSEIKGKKLNLTTELSSDSTLADGGFKKIVSGEPVQINKKFIAIHTINPIAKHVIATNNLPRVRDSSSGVYNRLLIIKFNRVVPKEKQDPELRDNLKKEIDGIINWAVEGLRRLIKNKGRFTEIKESVKLLEEYRLSQNPILSFIEESGVLEKDPNEKILQEIFRRKFQEYKGGKEFTKTTIGRMVKALGYESYASNGKRYYKGLKLRNINQKEKKDLPF